MDKKIKIPSNFCISIDPNTVVFECRAYRFLWCIAVQVEKFLHPLRCKLNINSIQCCGVVFLLWFHMGLVFMQSQNAAPICQHMDYVSWKRLSFFSVSTGIIEISLLFSNRHCFDQSSSEKQKKNVLKTCYCFYAHLVCFSGWMITLLMRVLKQSKIFPLKTFLFY